MLSETYSSNQCLCFPPLPVSLTDKRYEIAANAPRRSSKCFPHWQSCCSSSPPWGSPADLL